MMQCRTCTGLGAGDFRLPGKQYLKMNVSSLLYVKFYCVLAGKNSPDCAFLSGLTWSMMFLPIFAKRTDITPGKNQGNVGQLVVYLALSLRERSEKVWEWHGKDATGAQNLRVSFLALSVKAAWKMSLHYQCRMCSGKFPAGKSLTKEHFSGS